MFINPALTRFQNGPDGPPDATSTTNALATTPAGRAIDLEHFATGNVLQNPATMRQDPFGAVADRDKDVCTGICATVGMGAGIVASVATSTEIGIDGWISMGAAVGGTAGMFICTDGAFTPDDPPADPTGGRGGASGIDDGRGGAGGASGESPDPAFPAANDEPDAVGGFSSSTGAPESNAGKAGPSDDTSSPPAEDPMEGGMSVDKSSSSESSSSSSDDGRVGSSKGEGDMPADDATFGTFNPRVANFGDVSAVALAIQAALLNQANGSPATIGSIAGLGLGIRA